MTSELSRQRNDAITYFTCRSISRHWELIFQNRSRKHFPSPPMTLMTSQSLSASSANIMQTTPKYTDNCQTQQGTVKPYKFDVDRLFSQASKRKLRFNPDKCEVLRITQKRDLSLPTYSLGTSLKSVKCIKDLGIIASSDLCWSEHVRNVTANKANKLLGLVHRTMACRILVRSLRYTNLSCARFLNMLLRPGTLALERVQRSLQRSFKETEVAYAQITQIVVS